MTPSPSKAERTRRHLVQVAAERFATHGYHGTSYRDLVSASGLSKGAFYFHFPSKLELALEAYRTKQAELLERSMEAADKTASPRERLFAALEARAEAYAQDRSLRVLPRLSTDLARDPELVPVVREMHARAVGAFEGMIREAQDAGEVSPDLDPGGVARTVFATIVGMDEVSERESGGRDLLDRSRDFLVLLRRALGPAAAGGAQERIHP